jgi:CelD/BcsL family acetyltransferase involved in cellulose biosynthesis
VPPKSAQRDIVVSSLETHQSIESLAPEWDALADRASAPPFMRPGWAAAFHMAFGAEGLEVVAIRRDGRLVGVVPLQRDGAVLRSVTNWHTPEFAFVAEDKMAVDELATAVFELGTRRVSLSFMNPANSDLPACRERALGSRHRVIVRTLERPPYVRVEGDWEAYESSVDGKVRRDLRRRLRLLEKEGEVSIEVLDGTERLGELLEEGFEIEASGWKREQGTAIISRPETRAFYSDVARWAAERGWLRLAFLRLDGRPLAFQCGLEDGGTHYFLKGGFDREFQRFSPGKLLVAAMIERAFREGLELFDFGGEEEPFKLEWANGRRELVLFQGFAPSMSGLIDWAAFAYGRPLAKRALALAGR